MDLSFFWKNSIPYSIINNNYMGPSVSDVIKYYDELIIDDIDILKEKSLTLYHIEHIKNYKNINGDFVFVLMLMENLVTDLKIMENFGFIPYDIQVQKDVLGRVDLNMLFINKNHEENIIVNKKLMEG